MNRSNICIFVAAHRPIDWRLPEYCEKLEVNCSAQKELWDGYLHDNFGDNISDKNYCYSELTALYWAWKNSDAAIKGLCHYRRFFTRFTSDTMIPIFKLHRDFLADECLEAAAIRAALEGPYDIILTKPYGPYPDTAREELEKYVYQQDISAMEHVIREYFPEYFQCLGQVLDSRNLSYYNMFIASGKVFDDYCQWLFDVLKLVEDSVDITQYDRQHQRLFGYLGEVLLNVYVKRQHLKCFYCKAGFLEQDFSVKNRGKVFLLRHFHRLHEFLYDHGCYPLMLKLYKIFRKPSYERLKNYEIH